MCLVTQTCFPHSTSGLHEYYKDSLGSVLVSHEVSSCPLCAKAVDKSPSDREQSMTLARRLALFASKQGISKTNVKSRMGKLQVRMDRNVWVTHACVALTTMHYIVCCCGRLLRRWQCATDWVEKVREWGLTIASSRPN